MADDIVLDGDPRKLGMTIFRAALESSKQKRGKFGDPDRMKQDVEADIPKLAQQMAQALEGDVRDVYLMNALELMALDCLRRELG